MDFFVRKQFISAMLVFFALLFPLALPAVEQYNKAFSFELREVTLKDLFRYIEKNSDYVFLYASDKNLSKKVNVDVRNKTVREILDEVLEHTGLVYEIDGKQVIVKERKEEPISQSQKMRKKISGIVTDEATREPIAGAAIIVKGATIGTTSNIDGDFSLECTEGDTLLISFIGYQDQNIIVKSGNIYAITMKESVEMLGEVVVTAFGVGQKKESLVGAIQQVKPQELKVPTSRLSNAFAGRLAGVIAVSRSGEPGADGANFWIRGASTFSGATEPLIVMDGVEIGSAQLNALDPEVIESFSILKDATATALYGTRGANGVMIITTKNGGDLGKPIINFRVEGAVSQLSQVPELTDGITYMKLYNEAQSRNPETVDIYSQEKIDATLAGRNPYVYPNVNWYDEMFKKNSYAERVNFNIRGGSRRVDYFMSASVKHSDGNLKPISKDYFSYNNNINLFNYDLVNNLNIKATKTTTISLGLNFSVRDWQGPSSSASTIFSSAIDASPVDFPIRYPQQSVDDTHIRWGGKSGAAPATGYINPVADYVKGYKSELATWITGNLRLKQDLSKLLPGLNFDGLISIRNYSISSTSRSSNVNQYEIDTYDATADTYTLKIIGDERDTALSTSTSTSGTRRLYLQLVLNYNHTFNDIHDLNAMVLYNQEQNDTFEDGGGLYTSLPKRKQGIAGRISYGYDNRYLAEVNFGYNGSENFPQNHRFGFFPSVALGYTISEEKFWEPLRSIIPHLKFRASWGLVGNDNTGAGRFAYLENLSLGSIGYTTGTGANNMSLSGPKFSRYANYDMTWEVGDKKNVGLDMNILGDLQLSVDWFKEVRKDIFMSRRTVSDVIGVGGVSLEGNYGKMQNWGIDAGLDYNKQLSKDWFLNIKGTFTFARNKVLEYDEPDFVLYPNNSQLGHSINSIWGYEALGLLTEEMLTNYNVQHSFANQTLMPGDLYYKDQKSSQGTVDNIINTNDRIVLGHPTVPEIVYGFGASAKWKNLDFSVFFQGTGNVSLMMSGFHPFYREDNWAKRGLMQWIADDHWSETNPNPNAAYPRLTATSNANNEQASSYWLRNAAFLKLKNAEIGYTYKKMRFYISGNNLLTFSPFDLWDPEMGGGSGMKYPTTRTFNVGFQMTIN